MEVSLKGEYFISSGIKAADLIQAIKNAFEGSGLSPILYSETSEKEGSFQQRIDQIKHTRFGIYDLTTQEKTGHLPRSGCRPGNGERGDPNS